MLFVNNQYENTMFCIGYVHTYCTCTGLTNSNLLQTQYRRPQQLNVIRAVVWAGDQPCAYWIKWKSVCTNYRGMLIWHVNARYNCYNYILKRLSYEIFHLKKNERQPDADVLCLIPLWTFVLVLGSHTDKHNNTSPTVMTFFFNFIYF